MTNQLTLQEIASKIKSLAKELSNIVQNKRADLVQDHLGALSREEQMSDKEIFT